MKYWLGLMSLCFAVAGFAAGPFEEGKHYTKFSDVSRSVGDKIQVEEIFSYACGACFVFEQKVSAYKADLANDVAFQQTHIIWDKTTENLARAMYTAQAMGVMETAHPALFNAIHKDGKLARTPEEIYQVFEDAGIEVDEKKFMSTFNSFAHNSKVKETKRKMSRYGVSSTPQMVVNGQYRISVSESISHDDMLEITDYLVDQVRQQR